VRWLSRGAALLRFCALYAGVVKELEEDGRDRHNETARQLHSLVISHAFLATLCGMTDIISRMHDLARLFQSTEAAYEEVSQLIAATLSGLAADYRAVDTIKGPMWNQLRQAAGPVLAQGGRAAQYTFEGISVTLRRRSPHRPCAKRSLRFAQRVITNLKARFPDDKVMASLAIFNVESRL
jgi:hypothetical protein